MKLSKIELKMLKTAVDHEIDSYKIEDIEKYKLLYSQYQILLSNLKKEIAK